MVAVQNYHGNPAPPGKPVLTFQTGEVIELLRGDPESQWWEVSRRPVPTGETPGGSGTGGQPTERQQNGWSTLASVGAGRPHCQLAEEELPRWCPNLQAAAILKGGGCVWLWQGSTAVTGRCLSWGPPPALWSE